MQTHPIELSDALNGVRCSNCSTTKKETEQNQRRNLSPQTVVVLIFCSLLQREVLLTKRFKFSITKYHKYHYKNLNNIARRLPENSRDRRLWPSMN